MAKIFNYSFSEQPMNAFHILLSLEFKETENVSQLIEQIKEDEKAALKRRLDAARKRKYICTIKMDRGHSLLRVYNWECTTYNITYMSYAPNYILCKFIFRNGINCHSYYLREICDYCHQPKCCSILVFFFYCTSVEDSSF